MKTKRKELEIDFIGVQEPLTAQEEKALADYFKNKKAKEIRLSKKVKVQP